MYMYWYSEYMLQHLSADTHNIILVVVCVLCEGTVNPCRVHSTDHGGPGKAPRQERKDEPCP